MVPRPTGTITFLFTDIEGSSRLWERQPQAMRAALARHDRELREIFEAEGGYVFKTIGDAFCVAFDAAHSALTSALEAQRALRREKWDGIDEIKVRMALHTGTAELREGDYFGAALNRVARMLSSAHGGQVLLSLATEELVRDALPGGVQLRALGEHRLRDLARPEHLFQLTAPDLPSQFPVLRSLESVPNNLPVQVTSFIGRERELAEVKRLLGTTRLLTLTGPGGTGKTRLSLQVAADLLDQFPDGVWFVEFAMIADSALVVESVAAALELRQEADRTLAATLSSFARDKQLMLVWDNCEHVVAEAARLAEALLRSAPKVSILASSREPLGIAGEIGWPLQPLSLPEHWREITSGPDAIERLTQFEAVRLFIDRATMARPAFQLTTENVHLVAQICWRLDGIPLAIELAAARIRVLTLEQIVERLDDRFHLLTTGSRTAVPRQQTLRALIDWSYDLLSEPERTLLRRLVVFAQGRTLEAIEAVCSDHTLPASEIIDLLSQLLDKSLVFVEKRPEQGARYFLLESIWDYAEEKLLESGERDIFRRRHLAYFMAAAEEAVAQLCGPEPKGTLERWASEERNVRYALETALELPGEASKGLRLWTATQRYIEIRGLFEDARDQSDKLLAHPENAARDLVRARGLAAAGRLAWIAADMEETHRRQTEALAIFRELGDLPGVARALADLAFHALETGDIPQCRSFLEEGVTLSGSLAEPRLSAHVQHVRAALTALDGDFAQALAWEEASSALFREAGDIWQTLIVAWSLGLNAVAVAQYAVARKHLTECLQLGLNLDNRWGATYPLEAFGTLALAEGEYERAAQLFGASEAQRIRSGLVRQAPDHPAARAVLSAAPDFGGPAVEAARRQGRELSMEAAMTLALIS